MSIRCYSELIEIPTFEERFRYLQLNGSVGKDTFGFDRYMNQAFYQSREWKRVREHVILRDNGCDLGVDGYTIYGKILIHHMNPITVRDIATVSSFLMNPEYLICVSHTTHNAIHYGDENLIPKGPIIRTPNDTCPWKS
jgi:hypothetical protein